MAKSVKKKMSLQCYHVVKNGSRWAVKSNGLTLSSGHQTQREAVESGVAIARLTRGELAIHGRNGKIREKNVCTLDPFPPSD